MDNISPLSFEAMAKVLHDAFHGKQHWIICLPAGPQYLAFGVALLDCYPDPPKESLRILTGGDCLPGCVILAEKRQLERKTLQRLAQQHTGKDIRIPAGQDILLCGATTAQQMAFGLWLQKVLDAASPRMKQARAAQWN